MIQTCRRLKEPIPGQNSQQDKGPEASSSGKQANKLGEWQAGGGVLGETQIWEVGGIRAGRTLKHLSVRLL